MNKLNPCVSCGQKLQIDPKAPYPDIPYGAVKYTSSYLHGSTIPRDFDAFTPINVCDACLLYYKANYLKEAE